MSGTVTVACKLPNGLLLRVFQMVDSNEPVMGGGWRDVKRAEPFGEQVHIKGYALPANMQGIGLHVGGYALTPNVDADFWELWLNQNRDADYVRNGLIFAHEKKADAIAESKEKAQVWDGMGPLIPTKAGSTTRDRRSPKSKGLKIETANLSE